MKYRWKLLILLLSISLIPMVGARFFGVRSVRALGVELVSRIENKYIAGAENRLRLLVDAYSQIIGKDREHVEMALMMQAGEVGQVLGRDTSLPEKMYFAADFNLGNDLPADTIPSALHFKTGRMGNLKMLNVSYAVQVFKLATGVQRNRVEEDIIRLAALTPAYHRIHEHVRETVIWQYTILENGLHSAYPGHDGIPNGLDLREQPWYGKSIDSGGHWSDPYVDPETRQVVVAAVRPVFRSEGEVAGMTAMVVPISQSLNQRLLVNAIPPESHAFLCYIAERPETGRRSARIFAQENHTDIERRSWRTQLGSEWLNSKDEKQFQAMLDDVMADTGNIREMTHDDCNCLWAYGPIDGSAFLVVIIPRAEVLKPIREAEKSIQALITDLIRMTGYGLAGIVLLVILLAFAFSRTVTKPLQALAGGAEKLTGGDFNTRVEIRSKDEFGEMGRVFNEIGPRLEKLARMSRSMELAREVQQSLLPKANPSLKGLDIAGASISCDETGGDYYDFLDMGKDTEKKIGVVVGDVSDHGLPSALLMASARAFLRQRASMPGSISNIVSDVNRQLTRDVEMSGRFMTLFFAEVDLENHILRWVRAGHDPGMLYDPKTDTFESLTGTGLPLPLGIDEDTDFDECQRRIASGQIIVIGTDGIWESHNPKGEMFGKTRLREIVQAHTGESARVILETVMSALDRFRQSARLEDDVTLVIVKVA